MKKYKPLFESTEAWSAIQKILDSRSYNDLMALANLTGVKDFIKMNDHKMLLEAIKDKLSGMDDLEIDYLYKRLKEKGLI